MQQVQGQHIQPIQQEKQMFYSASTSTVINSCPCQPDRIRKYRNYRWRSLNFTQYAAGCIWISLYYWAAMCNLWCDVDMTDSIAHNKGLASKLADMGREHPVGQLF